MSNENKGGAGGGNDAIILFCMGIAILVILWFVYSKNVIGISMFIRKLELAIPALFNEQAAAMVAALDRSNPQNMSFASYKHMLSVTGAALKPWAIGLGGLIVTVFVLVDPSMKRKLSIRSLIDSEMRIWPTIAPASIGGIISRSMTSGRWACGMTEWEFAHKHGLAYKRVETPVYDYAVKNLMLNADVIDTNRVRAKMEADVERRAGEGFRVAMEANLLVDGALDTKRLQDRIKEETILYKRTGTLNEPLARAMFNQQLGRRWGGFRNLRPVEQGIAAMLVTRIVGDKNTSMDLLNKMALDFTAMEKELIKTKGKSKRRMDFSWAPDILKKHENNPRVKAVIDNHAYVYTVFAGFLEAARTGGSPGVLSSSWFKWLRAEHRTLWYTLNNVGRYAFYVEAAGIMSHYLFEKRVGTRIYPRMTQNAVSLSRNGKLVAGLSFAMKNFKPADSMLETDEVMKESKPQVITYGRAPAYVDNLAPMPAEARALSQQWGDYVDDDVVQANRKQKSQEDQQRAWGAMFGKKRKAA